MESMTFLFVGALIVLVIGFLIGTGWHSLISARKGDTQPERRPIYWNLIYFATVGATFSLLAMLLVAENDRTGIALLFLGLIGGYAASIKELDLAKVELDKLRLERAVKEDVRSGPKDEDD